MKKTFSVLMLSLIIQLTYGQTDKEQVLKVLDDQTVCWNKADIDCFMEGYWKSDSLMFVGSKGITYGWQGTLDRYKKSYPDSESMGKLRFEIMEANPMGMDVYFVVGKFFLSRTIGDLDGIFTLIFRTIDNKWVIAADQTG
ncbi:MAG: DUF4440 domain-containing protein [Cyclobacteriaceae bacterium]